MAGKRKQYLVFDEPDGTAFITADPESDIDENLTYGSAEPGDYMVFDLEAIRPLALKVQVIPASVKIGA